MHHSDAAFQTLLYTVPSVIATFPSIPVPLLPGEGRRRVVSA